VLSQREYNREMAFSLKMSVGLDEAIDQAQQNQWEGVLAELLSMPKEIPPKNLKKTSRSRYS